MNPTELVQLNQPILKALFERQIQGLVVTVYENEKPPRGLAGSLDWYFRGALSSYVRSGTITGKAGELTYLPMTLRDTTYHLLLVGSGTASSPGARAKVTSVALDPLQNNLQSLQLTGLGISLSDFGHTSAQSFSKSLISKSLSGVSLWIAP